MKWNAVIILALGFAHLAGAKHVGDMHEDPHRLRGLVDLDRVPGRQLDSKSSHGRRLQAALATSIGIQCINIDGTFGSTSDTPTPPGNTDACTPCAAGADNLFDWDTLMYPDDWAGVYTDPFDAADDDKTDGECVSSGQVNSKTDFISTAFASNPQSIYFLGSRLGNKGQAVLLYIFTKAARIDNTEGPCTAPEFEPTWLIEEKDFVIRVLFPSSAPADAPEVSTFLALVDFDATLNLNGIQDSLFSANAADFWMEVNGCVSCNDAVLTPLTSEVLLDDGFTYPLDRNGKVLSRSICEAEINIASLGLDICDGLTVYGSAASLTSNSGTFKDFLEEQLYNFGGLNAAQNDPVIDCDSATFSVSDATEGPICQWVLYLGTEASGLTELETGATFPCDTPVEYVVAFLTLPNNLGEVHTVKLKVSDATTNCETLSPGETFTPYANVAATLTLPERCSGSFDYTVVASGGLEGSYTYELKYSVEEGDDVTVPNPGSSGTVSNIVGTGTVSVTATVTDSRNCFDADTQNVEVYPPLSVSATLTGSCESTFDYDATVSGGRDDGTLTYAWSFDPLVPDEPNPFSTISSGAYEPTDPGTYSVKVVVAETCTACTDAVDGKCSAEGTDDVTVYDALSITVTAPNLEQCEDPVIPDDFDPYTATVEVTGGTGSYTLDTSVSDADAITVQCTTTPESDTCAITVATDNECFLGWVDITASDTDTDASCADAGKRVSLTLQTTTTFEAGNIPAPAP